MEKVLDINPPPDYDEWLLSFNMTGKSIRKLLAKRQANNLIRKIKKCLSTDLLSPKYPPTNNPLEGHCYVAAEALFHLLGGKNAGYHSCYLRVEGESHWFIEDAFGNILDPTAGQFDREPNYSRKIRKGFLTKEPSKRAKILIERVKTL